MKIEVIIINLTGMILKMRYCILEQVGAGGEGHLYLARDMELGNYWAVKELSLEKKRGTPFSTFYSFWKAEADHY